MKNLAKIIAARIAAWIEGWRGGIDECKRKGIINLDRGDNDKELRR